MLFLAEAFTKPAMMHALGKAGFQQSYTYFTWRNEKWEIEEYMKELTSESDSFFRPSFWPNTPDILPHFLQWGGKPAFTIRAVTRLDALSAVGHLLRFRAVQRTRRSLKAVRSTWTRRSSSTARATGGRRGEAART